MPSTRAADRAASLIFLCYASEDKPRIDEIYLALKSAGLDPWMDKPPKPYELDGIQPGRRWSGEIRRKIIASSYFLAFLSKHSVQKKGYVQREYRLAIENMAEMPHDATFLIPVLLESDCVVPQISVDALRLDELQWFDLEADGLDTLITFLCDVTGTEKLPRRNPVTERLLTESHKFFHSIGDQQTIQLRPQIYLADESLHRSNYPSRRLLLEDVFDGRQLIINSVSNLTVKGSLDKPGTRIFVDPRYAFVLYFRNCHNIVLESLTLAHDPPGFCRGGVLKLESCTNITITRCTLRGSGTVGLELEDVRYLRFFDSCIEHCTYGILTMESSQNVHFFRSQFASNKQFFGIQVSKSNDITFHECELHNNIFPEGLLFDVAADSGIKWDGGSISMNDAKALSSGNNVDLIAARMRGNRFRDDPNT